MNSYNELARRRLRSIKIRSRMLAKLDGVRAHSNRYITYIYITGVYLYTRAVLFPSLSLSLPHQVYIERDSRVGVLICKLFTVSRRSGRAAGPSQYIGYIRSRRAAGVAEHAMAGCQQQAGVAQLCDLKSQAPALSLSHCRQPRRGI